MSLRDFMRLAIDEAQIGGTPYGCVIVKDNRVIVQAYNTVIIENDPTAHAEINAVRKLCVMPIRNRLVSTCIRMLFPFI